MSWRTNLALLVVAVLLSAWAFFFENSPAPWERLGKVFRDLETDDIYEVEIARGAAAPRSAGEAEGAAEGEGPPGGDPGGAPRPIVLRREAADGPGAEATWWIVEPLRFRANYPRVAGIVFAITDLDRIGEARAGAGAFPEGGPELTLRFRYRRLGEDLEQTIEVGNDHPDSSLPFTYVRVGGESFVTGKGFRSLVTATLGELRSRALVPLSPDRVARWTIEAERRREEGDTETAITVLERTGGRWRLREPLDALADRELTESLLAELSAWKIASFTRDDAAAPEDLARYGLARPRLAVTLERRGDGETLRVEVGSEAPEDSAAPGGARLVYVRHAGEPFVYAAEGAIVERLRAEPEVFRSRHVFDLGLAEIDGLRIEPRAPSGSAAGGAAGGEASIELRRIETGEGLTAWTVRDGARGASFAGDSLLLDGLSRDLKHLRVERFLGAEATDAVSPPRALVAIGVDLGSPAEEWLALHLGNRSRDPLDAGVNMHHVACPGEPGSYLVVTRLPDLIEEGPDAFRRRDISELDPDSVVEVEIEKEGRRWRLMRPRSGERWSLSTASSLRPGFEVDSTRLDRLVEALGRGAFRVARYVPDLEDLASRGLDFQAPHRSLRLSHVADEAYRGFRRLVVGPAVPAGGEAGARGAQGGAAPGGAAAPGARYPARVDLEGTPPFLLEEEVPRLLEEAAAHLAAVTAP
jgi:hypothetical protein